MQRWAITLDGDTRKRLTEEHLELGTEVSHQDGSPLLVFRDRFVGLRVAFATGAPLEPYQAEVESGPAAGARVEAAWLRSPRS